VMCSLELIAHQNIFTTICSDTCEDVNRNPTPGLREGHLVPIYSACWSAGIYFRLKPKTCTTTFVYLTTCTIGRGQISKVHIVSPTPLFIYSGPNQNLLNANFLLAGTLTNIKIKRCPRSLHVADSVHTTTYYDCIVRLNLLK
jgi:hypothetical protein